ISNSCPGPNFSTGMHITGPSKHNIFFFVNVATEVSVALITVVIAVRTQRVCPPRNNISADCIVSLQAPDTSRIMVGGDVTVYSFAIKFVVLKDTVHEMASDMLIVEIFCKKSWHVWRTYIDVTVYQVRTNVKQRVALEQLRRNCEMP